MPGLTFDSLTSDILLLKNLLLENSNRIYSCMSEDELNEYEESYDIRLPDDYRIFLMCVGSGMNYGPCEEGLLKFGRMPFLYPRDFKQVSRHISDTFPFIEDSMHNHIHGVGGYIPLGTASCSNGYYWILICEGYCRGEVWIVSLSGRFMPCLPRMTFIQWLTDWIKGGNSFNKCLRSLYHPSETATNHPTFVRAAWVRRGAIGSIDRDMLV
ncbi:hypothetical protein BDB01DRAFT_101679 [Pilobolus umbonatus]|nr:hypothetical protein BDB01DRAFT_101679 [Pilobolus umbonatus]